MPVGTVVIRQRKATRLVRYVKVRKDGPSSRRWILYARWWWEKHKGPIPARKIVFHLDGDQLNDKPENLALGTPGTKLVLAHRRDPAMSKANHRRINQIRGELNRQNGRINRSKNFLKNYWYPVVDEMGVILNVPFRRRKRVLASFGIDVSKYPSNGRGSRPDSQVQRTLRFCRVRPVNSRELALRRYSTYCLADPASGNFTGPMSVSADRLIAQLERMQIWPHAVKYAKKDLVERK